jgi:hypothetical protein
MNCPIELIDGQGAGKIYFVNFTSASVVEVKKPIEGVVVIPFDWGWREVKNAFKARFGVRIDIGLFTTGKWTIRNFSYRVYEYLQIPEEYDIDIVDYADARIVYRGQDGEIFRHLERSHAVGIQVYEPVGSTGRLDMMGRSSRASFESVQADEPEWKRLSLMAEVEKQLRELGIESHRTNGESWAEAAVKRASSPEAAVEWIISELEEDVWAYDGDKGWPSRQWRS